MGGGAGWGEEKGKEEREKKGVFGGHSRCTGQPEVILDVVV